MGKKKSIKGSKTPNDPGKQQAGKKLTQSTGINVPVLMEILTELKTKWNLSKFQEEIVITQILVESEGLRKEEAVNSKNVGGLKYSKTLTNALPSDSYKAKAKESPKNIKDPYAVFPTWGGYLYSHIMETALGRPYKIKDIPLNATNMDDFARLITLNGYHQTTEAEYKKSLTSWTPTVKRLLGEIESLEDRAIFLEESGMKSKYDKVFADFLELSDQGRITNENQLGMPIIKIHDRYLRSAKDSVPTLNELPFGEARVSRFSAEKSPSGTGFLYKVSVKSRGRNGQVVTNEYSMPDKNALKKEEEIRRYKAQHEVPFFLKPLKTTSPGDFSIPYILQSYNSRIGAKMPSTTAEIKHLNYSMPNTTPDAIGIDEVYRASGNLVTGGDSHYIDLATDKNKVTIHLNTPLIGSLSLTTQDTSHSVNTIKMQVEQVLLEVLNNVNTA